MVSDLSGPARWFLDHARVALRSGHVFGTGGAGHVRVNFATSQAILTEAVTRMGRAVGRQTQKPLNRDRFGACVCSRPQSGCSYLGGRTPAAR